MPALAVPVLGAAIGGLSISAAGAISFSLGAFALNLVGSFVLSGLQRALTSKPSAPKPSAIKQQGTTVSVRETDASHKHIYGVERVGGVYRYMGSSGTDNKYLNMVLVLAGHEVAGIDEIWFDDVCIPIDALDANGKVISGRFANKATIRKHLGSPNQTVDTFLKAASNGEWTDDHRLRGRAYIVVQLERDQDIYPSGVPNITAVVRGGMFTDPRDNVRRFTRNIGLFIYEKSTASHGFAARTGRFSATQNAAQLNICDEIVSCAAVDHSVTSVAAGTDILTLSGTMLKLQLGDQVEGITSGTLPGGLSPSTPYYVVPYQYKDTVRIQLATSLTNALEGIVINITDAGSGAHTIRKTGEPRYWGGSVVDLETPIGDILRDMLSGCAGRWVVSGGRIRIVPGAYTAPVMTLNLKTDFASGPSIDTALPLNESFNGIKGKFKSSVNFWQLTDYPKYAPAGYLAADNGNVEVRDYPLPFTNSVTTAQRISKIELKRARQEIAIESTAFLKALKAQCCENVAINSEEDGFEEKEFEIASQALQLGSDGNPTLTVPLGLRETAEEIYDHESADDGVIDPAPNSTLPNPFVISPLTGLSFSSRAVNTADADTLYQLVLMWNAHPDYFVLSGGKIEIEFKESSEPDTAYSPLPADVKGSDTSTVTAPSTPGVSYDFRMRPVNQLGMKPNTWSYLLNCAVGSSGGVTSTEDYESVTDVSPTPLDYGAANDSVGPTVDNGFVA
jgi:hypothetical protein